MHSIVSHVSRKLARVTLQHLSLATEPILSHKPCLAVFQSQGSAYLLFSLLHTGRLCLKAEAPGLSDPFNRLPIGYMLRSNVLHKLLMADGRHLEVWASVHHHHHLHKLHLGLGVC